MYIKNIKNDKENIKTIIYADDSLIDRLIFEKYYDRFENFKVLTFENSSKALKYILNNLVDLIVLDYLIEPLDGMDLLNIIKNHKNLKNIPTFIVTSSDKVDILHLTSLSLASDQCFIPKPLNIQKFEYITSKLNICS